MMIFYIENLATVLIMVCISKVMHKQRKNEVD